MLISCPDWSSEIFFLDNTWQQSDIVFPMKRGHKLPLYRQRFIRAQKSTIFLLDLFPANFHRLSYVLFRNILEIVIDIE